MALLVLCGVIRDLTVGVIHREHVLRREELVVNFRHPRARCRTLQHIHAVFSGGAVPRLGRVNWHWLWPLLKWGVGYQSGDGHPCPHCPSVNIRLVGVVGFSACEYDLKAKAPTRHCGNSDCHRMKKLTMIFLVVVRVFTPHPALEVRDVALQKSHLVVVSPSGVVHWLIFFVSV